MSKPQLQPQTPEEIIALALNEQGYLLQHRILDVIHTNSRADQWGDTCAVEAFEVPVSLPNHDETRVDIVLKHKKAGSPWRVVVECKRAAPDYKRWVFFAQNQIGGGPSPNYYYFEHANLAGTWCQNTEPEPKMSHRLDSRAAASSCPAYDFGVEARLNRVENPKRVSATDSIEGALHQVTLGQAGLALKLRAAHELTINLIPVVVTTAVLTAADFNPQRVSLSHGLIEPKDLKLQPRKWLAVNYRASDVICQYSTSQWGIMSARGKCALYLSFKLNMSWSFLRGWINISRSVEYGQTNRHPLWRCGQRAVGRLSSQGARVGRSWPILHGRDCPSVRP
jgi:hypothetical protein